MFCESFEIDSGSQMSEKNQWLEKVQELVRLANHF